MALLEACQSQPGFSLLLGQDVRSLQLCADSGRVRALDTADHRSAFLHTLRSACQYAPSCMVLQQVVWHAGLWWARQQWWLREHGRAI